MTTTTSHSVDRGASTRASRAPSTSSDGPTSVGQRGFAVMHQLYSGVQPLNTGLAIDLTGPLDVSALERSLDALIVRHAQLRTTFHDSPEGLVARTHDVDSQPLVHEDVRGLSGAAQDAKVQELERAAITFAFDIRELYLMRATLVQRADDQHVLILVNHHVTGDGTALFKIYLEELAALYAAFVAGEDSPLEPLEATFDDFIAEQARKASGKNLERGLKYWRKHLDGAPPHIELATDRSRPPIPTGAGGRVQGRVLPGIMERVESFAGGESTPIAVLLGAFYALLYRYTQQGDMVVGLPVANRRKPELAGVFGPMINTLPLRAKVAAADSFTSLVERTQSVTFRSFMKQDVPFEEIVAGVERSRDMSRAAIHQIVFNFMTFSVQSLSMHGLQTRVRRLFPEAAWLDLVVEAEARPDGFCLSINYNADIYDPATVRGMVEHYYALLEGALDAPDTAVGELPLLTSAETARFDGWNQGTYVDFPRLDAWQPLFDPPVTPTVHGMIAARARLDRDRPAVTSGDRTLNYGELDDRSNQLARYLQERGAGPGKFVGLCTDRGIDMVVGLLGILKSGAAYVPLDPAFPVDRLAYMAADSGLKLVVSDRSVTLDFSLFEGTEVLRLEDESARIDGCSTDALDMEYAPDSLAYAIYTSGSTGKPKGVELPHSAVTNFITSMAQTPGLTRDDVLVAVTTMSFDIAVLEIYLPLTVGARVVVASKATTVNGEALLALIKSEGATIMQATPVTWRLLLAAGFDRSTPLKALCGGEALPRDLAQNLVPAVDSLWNMYGPTETTVWSSVYPITDADAPILVGTPIQNTSLYVLDPQGQRVPVGVPGELWIGGDGVAVGYHGRPDLTEERFVPDPFRDTAGARMYRTGDQARFTADGDVECMGRLDTQVKVRGYRIELGEIEAVIAEMDDVQQVAVAVVDLGHGSPELVGYYLAERDLEPADFRKALSASLPAYMVPGFYVRMDNMPLTPNGKVDRKALPKPEGKRAVHTDGEPPRNDTEMRLAQMFCEVLELEQVGIDDHFFDLGGHSLTAVVLVRRIGETLDESIELGTLFNHPTIRQLAENLGTSHQRAGQSNVVTLAQGNGDTPLFLLAGITLYLGLARQLGEQTTHGVFLQDEVSLDDASTDALRSEDASRMAQQYLEAIQKVQPRGPYALGGVCFGGVLAFEVARLLEARGEKVSYLLMMETVLSEGRRVDPRLWAQSHLERLQERGVAHILERVSERAQRLTKRLRDQRNLQQLDDTDPASAQDEALEFDRARNDRLARAMGAFRPRGKVHPERTVIVRANDEPIFDGYFVDSLGGMAEYIEGPIEFHASPGDHLGILRPPEVLTLGARLMPGMPGNQSNDE